MSNSSEIKPQCPFKTRCTKSQKPQRSSVFLKTSSDDGIMKEKLQQSEPLEVCDCMTSHKSILHPLQSKKQSIQKQWCCTQESLLPSKEMILRDNKSILEKIYLTNVPDTKFLKYRTLGQGSISRGRDFYEFWDKSKKDAYQQLSWLQETDWQGLDSSLLNGCAQSLEQKSWFLKTKILPPKKNLEKTSCPLSKFIVVDGMEEEDTPQKNEVTKTLKLKLKPNIHQKKKLAEWAGSLRFTYNKAINQLQKTGNTIKSKISLQNRFVVKKTQKSGKINNFISSKPWLEACPSSMRKYAVRDAKSNLTACFSNLRAKNIDHFKAPFKTKKAERENGWCWTMEKANVSRDKEALYIFKKKLGSMKYHSVKQLKKLMPGKHPIADCKIQKDKYGDFYLILSIKSKCEEKVKKINKPVSCDPGVRKFLVTYSPDAQEGSTMYGVRWASVVFPLALQHDTMQSKASKMGGGKAKRSLLKAMVRVRKKIHNLKREMRFQVANDIVKHHDLVMMPKLDSGKLTIKKTRKLTTKVSRTLLMAGHCEFFDLLKRKCFERGKIFLHVSEHYTSQTCPCCGKLSKCNETFHCRACEFTHDRDVVGALNIFLRSLRTEAPEAR